MSQSVASEAHDDALQIEESFCELGVIGNIRFVCAMDRVSSIYRFQLNTLFHEQLFADHDQSDAGQKECNEVDVSSFIHGFKSSLETRR